MFYLRSLFYFPPSYRNLDRGGKSEQDLGRFPVYDNED